MMVVIRRVEFQRDNRTRASHWLEGDPRNCEEEALGHVQLSVGTQIQFG